MTFSRETNAHGAGYRALHRRNENPINPLFTLVARSAASCEIAGRRCSALRGSNPAVDRRALILSRLIDRETSLPAHPPSPTRIDTRLSSRRLAEPSLRSKAAKIALLVLTPDPMDVQEQLQLIQCQEILRIGMAIVRRP